MVQLPESRYQKTKANYNRTAGDVQKLRNNSGSFDWGRLSRRRVNWSPGVTLNLRFPTQDRSNLKVENRVRAVSFLDQKLARDRNGSICIPFSYESADVG